MIFRFDIINCFVMPTNISQVINERHISIMSHPNNRWLFTECDKVWYVINNVNSVPAIISHQGSYSQR